MRPHQRRAGAARLPVPESRLHRVGAALLPQERPPPRGPVGGEGSGLEGARARCARSRLARDRDQTDAVRPTDGRTSRPGRAARACDGPARAALGEHLAHQGPRRRGGRGAALTKQVALDAAAIRDVLRPLPPDSGKEARGRVLIVGPGLAHAAGTDDFVIAVVRNAKTVPAIVDADGLNALARTEDWPALLPPKTILTPHDGEAARLAGRVVPNGAARIAFAER